MAESALNTQRARLVDYVKAQLTGLNLTAVSTDNGIENSVLEGVAPLERFFTGFLFPIGEDNESFAESSLDDTEDSSPDPDNSPLETAGVTGKRRRYLPPSSVGFSFYITGGSPKLRVYYKAISYKRLESRDARTGRFQGQSWERQGFADTGDETEREVVFQPAGANQYNVLYRKHEHHARIDALWRPFQEGHIVTITLSNRQTLPADQPGGVFHQQQNERTLFEVVLECIIDSGEIGQYPLKNKALLSEEERQIELRYKDVPVYAVGHGAAANWEIRDTKVTKIYADFLPAVEVPQVTANTAEGTETVLQFAFLQERDNQQLSQALNVFIGGYADWVDHQTAKAALEDEDDRVTAALIVAEQQQTLKRMSEGVRLLDSDPSCRLAFALMNQAMLMQWQATDHNKGSLKPAESYQWRPFQLAFILMALASAADEDHADRDTLDLIWFPTGGGKTEAYLGLMAFVFILRRLRYPGSGGGTVAIMRYTLRLLTAQQFLRANKVILALELIRRTLPEKLGEEAFSSGIWVGGATSPNTFKQACEFTESKAFSKLVIQSCPWCEADFTAQNYQAAEQDFYFQCVNPGCDFGKSTNKRLPCNVVDEALYQSPPTLLISTVDKFARFAWEARANAFLGRMGCRPPELIIQDELHLISGALGSIVGLYEAGFETALVSRGVYPKYVASTATIKQAAQQVRTLFAREMKLFPPSGLRHDDSYFAKTVPLERKPGRLYLGYLAPLISRQECLSPLAAALLSAPVALFRDEEIYQDRWWTQLVYHGSLKGVANSNTLYQSHIRRYQSRLVLEALKQAVDAESPGYLNSQGIRTREDFEKITEPVIQALVKQFLPLREIELCSLTSQNTAEENAALFTRLDRAMHEPDSLDVALATNMISVGLDVSRLALMLINGQPLTTAEYIQASSRVGRGETPGIVFINYYKTQARSLSHYETFRSYHESFYRYVEPSSLTPFTWQARQRALHAALVIAIRHGANGLLKNTQAGDFKQQNAATGKIIQLLAKRCYQTLEGQDTLAESVAGHLNELCAAWQAEADYCRAQRRNLDYYSKDRNRSNLLCNFNEETGLWKTLQSMRNVENNSLFKLQGGVSQYEA